MSSDDSFDDSFDEDDFDQAFKQVEATQKVKHQQSELSQPHIISNATPFKPVITSQKPADNDKLYEILGENAILKNQLAKLQQQQTSKEDQLKTDFRKLISEKEESIQALNDNLLQVKSENEFLVSENKNLNQTFSKRRKLRHIDINQNDEPSNLIVSSTQNTSYNINNTTTSNVSKGEHIPDDDDHDITMSNNYDPAPPILQTRVLVVNQALSFQNEKTFFIETLTNYVIPGMELPVLQYLESISSTFEYLNDDFQIYKNQNSFKSAILKYLINFQDRDRIDNLLARFIKILFTYVEQAIETDSSLLAVPYLISLVNFSLNYKHLAINETLIGELTTKVCDCLLSFPDILKQEYEYLSLPKDNSSELYQNDEIDFTFVEKPIHTKILDVFTAIFLNDVLLTLSKIAALHLFTKETSACNSVFWKHLPEKLLTNSLMSKKTPIFFIRNTIDILMNSIIDEDRFAFENIRMNALNKVKELPLKSRQLLEQAIPFLINFSPSQIHFEVYGLNSMIGSNKHIKLLDLVSVPKSELSSYATTNSFVTYESILNDDFRMNTKKDEFLLHSKLQILNLFEVFYSSSIMLSLPAQTHNKLLCTLSKLIGEQQEMIYRAPRSPNNGMKVEIITKSIILIHHLLEGESIVDSKTLPTLTYRELILSLMKITANSMKNKSIEFLMRLRVSQDYQGTAFIGKQEMKELDNFGLWNSILSIDKLSLDERAELNRNRTQIETDICNGIELNYPDEMISIARDLFSKLLTEDEAERIYKSINYIDYQEEFRDFEIE